MTEFKVSSTTEQCFPLLVPSELLKILKDYARELRQETPNVDPILSAEEKCVDLLLENFKIIDFKSGSNSVVARNLSSCTPEGNRAYVQTLLSAMGNPHSNSFVKAAFLLEAELRWAVLCADAAAPNSALKHLCRDKAVANDSLVQRFCVGGHLVKSAGRFRGVAPAVERSKKERKLVDDPLLADAVDTLKAKLMAAKLARLVFCDATLAPAVARSEETQQALSNKPELTLVSFWEDTFTACGDILKPTRQIVSELLLSPWMSKAADMFASVAQRGINAFVPVNSSLPNRLSATAHEDDQSALNAELVALTTSHDELLAAAAGYITRLQSVAEAQAANEPFAALLNAYGITASLAAAHECDVIQGSVLCRNGQEFEDSLLTVHIPQIVEQIVAPACAAECKLTMEQSVTWCLWCLRGRHDGEPVPPAVEALHKEGKLPIFQLHTNVQVMQVAPPKTFARSTTPAHPADEAGNSNSVCEEKSYITRGELDAVILDERDGSAVFLLELKQNIADIGKAQLQRNKLYDLLDQVWNGPITHADPAAPSPPAGNHSRPNKGASSAKAPQVEFFFSSKDHRSCDFLQKHFSSACQDRKKRWIFTTTVDNTDAVWKELWALPAGGDVRHALEQCLVASVSLTAQRAYSEFARTVLQRTAQLSCAARRAWVSKLRPNDVAPASPFQLCRAMMLSSAFCRDAGAPYVPFEMPFCLSETALVYLNRAEPGQAAPDNHGTAKDVLSVVREVSRPDAGGKWADPAISFGYPIYESLTYDMAVVQRQFGFYQKLSEKRGKNSANLVSVVQELVSVGSLRSLLILVNGAQ